MRSNALMGSTRLQSCEVSLKGKRMNIRLFEKTDAIAVSEMIRKTIRISNTKDYPLELQ